MPRRSRQLAGGEEHAALRAFESVLLEELGYGVDLARDAGSGRPLRAIGIISSSRAAA